jgi:acyl-CoA reductase-like NAD-dependent aldehyde dehydrogenase
MALKPHLIGGEWVQSSEAGDDINPSDLKDVVGSFSRADRATADKAIAAAKAAFPGWARSTPQQRFDLLDAAGDEILKRKQELGELLAREEGKTLPEGIGEAARAAPLFQFVPGATLRRAGERVPSVRPGIEVDITREPLGVVGLITPWNFPLAIPAWKIAPALAYGNAVVFKPADLVPGSAWAIAEILARAGAPAGVFNLVMGRGSVVGEALLDSPDVAAISSRWAARTR